MTYSQPDRPLFDHDEIERTNRQAKVAQAKFLKDNFGKVFAVAGSVGVVCTLAIILIPGDMDKSSTHPGNTTQMDSLSTKLRMDATTEMEWLSRVLEHTKALTPNTAHEIAQLIREPIYDCNQGCPTWLEQRNHLAQLKLKAVLAKKGLSDENPHF